MLFQYVRVGPAVAIGGQVHFLTNAPSTFLWRTCATTTYCERSMPIKPKSNNLWRGPTEAIGRWLVRWITAPCYFR
jgi:hypothetical protein